jgi:hypothetical protein
MSAATVSRSGLLAGRVVRVVIVLFLLFDAVGHVVNPAPVMEAMARIGFPVHLSAAVGVVEGICLALYVVPRTAVLGALLLTGYLGGATAIQLRAGSPPFEVFFPVLCGMLVWGGLLLARPDVRTFLLSPNGFARNESPEA